MRHFHLFLLSCLACALSACSTGPQVNSSVLSAATSRGVAADTTAKMSAAERLGFGDIRNLVSKGVPDAMIIAYLNSTKETTRFSAAQLAARKSAGADAPLLAFLSEEQGFYGRNPTRSSRAMAPAGQYTNSRGYQDEQPFAYNEPVVDGFFNSSYEDSLYSPFSFN